MDHATPCANGMHMLSISRSRKPENAKQKSRKAIEKQYGPNSKTAGSVYCRYHKPGFTGARHSSVTSPTAIIKVQCEDNELDVDVMIAALYKCREEKAEEQKEVTRREAEARKTARGDKEICYCKVQRTRR